MLEEALDRSTATSRWRTSSLAQVYADAESRRRRPCKLLQDAQAKFPADDRDRLRARRGLREAEEVRRGRSRVPAGAGARARERRRRSTISATCWPSAASGSTSRSSYLKRALEIEPDNGSYLDSLGWAYFKADKLDLAEENLQRAADQLKTNSVVQDHYGDVLFKLGRFDEAIAAWNARARRRRRLDRPRRHRPEDPRRRAETANEDERTK